MFWPFHGNFLWRQWLTSTCVPVDCYGINGDVTPDINSTLADELNLVWEKDGVGVESFEWEKHIQVFGMYHNVSYYFFTHKDKVVHIAPKSYSIQLKYEQARETWPLITPQAKTVMLDGIPPIIHHGRARKVARHGMPVNSLGLVFHGLINYNDHNCDFTSIRAIWNRSMVPKVIYESRIFRRDAGWKSAGDAGWK